MNRVKQPRKSEEIIEFDEVERDLETEKRIKSLLKNEGINKRIQISIKLDPELLSTIKAEALKRNMPYQSLVSLVLTDRFLTNKGDFGLIRSAVRDEFKNFGKSFNSNLHSILHEELLALANKSVSKQKVVRDSSKRPTPTKRKATGR